MIKLVIWLWNIWQHIQARIYWCVMFFKLKALVIGTAYSMSPNVTFPGSSASLLTDRTRGQQWWQFNLIFNLFIFSSHLITPSLKQNDEIHESFQSTTHSKENPLNLHVHFNLHYLCQFFVKVILCDIYSLQCRNKISLIVTYSILILKSVHNQGRILYTFYHLKPKKNNSKI